MAWFALHSAQALFTLARDLFNFGLVTLHLAQNLFTLARVLFMLAWFALHLAQVLFILARVLFNLGLGALVFPGFGSWNHLVFLDPSSGQFAGIALSFWVQRWAPYRQSACSSGSGSRSWSSGCGIM